MVNKPQAQRNVDETTTAWGRLQDLLEYTMPRRTAKIVDHVSYLAGKVQLWPR